MAKKPYLSHKVCYVQPLSNSLIFAEFDALCVTEKETDSAFNKRTAAGCSTPAYGAPHKQTNKQVRKPYY
jgi:hypothetical protein